MTKQVFLEAVVSLLSEMGFKKRAGDVFTLDLAPGVLGWVGLNRATQHRGPGEVEVNPVVGVRFQDVERLVAECRGEKLHAYLPPTFSTPLGYLMPENRYKAWVFGPGRSEEVARDMVHAIATHAIAFMRSTSDLVGLRRRLQDRSGGLEQQLAYRRPAAALVAGDAEQARVLVNEAIAAIGTRTDLAAEDYKRFAEALRSRLPAQSSP